MECQDVRMLLTFAQRGCENFDAAEREALQDHLEKCPDCASQAEAERRLDEALGRAMRTVPVPAGLKEKVLAAVAGQPRPVPWRRIVRDSLAAAALLVLVAVGIVAWHLHGRPLVNWDDVQGYAARGNGWSDEEVEQFFRENRLNIRVPRSIDSKFLQRVDIVEFKGERVARLSYENSEAKADVLVLSAQQYRIPQDSPELASIQIRRDGDLTYLIFCRGDIKALERTLQ